MMNVTSIQVKSDYSLKLRNGENVNALVEVIDPDKYSPWINIGGIEFDNIRQWIDRACIKHMERIEGDTTVLEDVDENIRVTIKPKGDDNAVNTRESSV